MPQRSIRPRRTQAERREQSRQKLLDATLDTLAERGFAGTSLPEVLRRAELSNGALWHHFPSKSELLVTALQHGWREWATPADVARLEGLLPPERLDAAIEYFWRYTQGRVFQAQVELIRASNSDKELANALRAIDEPTSRLFHEGMGRLLGPELVSGAPFERHGRFLALAMYGAALTRGLRSARATRALLEELKQEARDLFGVSSDESLAL